jgi:hypothetical protein
MLPRCSTESAGDEDDDKLQISAGYRSKGTVDWRRLRPPLLDSFHEDAPRDTALLLDHAAEAGVACTTAFFLDSGELAQMELRDREG